MIEFALAALRAGRPIVVADDFDRENEGDLILAAELATPAQIGFIVRHTSGVLCVALTAGECLRLNLPPMTERNEDPKGTAYTISVDARDDVTTGISASDRARTIKMLAQPETTAADLTRPGHIFPLRAVDGGTSARRGHTEAAVDLMQLAGLRPAGVIAELVDDSGEMLRGEALRNFALEHDLPMLTMDQVVEAASVLERERSISVVREVQTFLPTEHGRFTVTAYRSSGGAEHLALHMGEIENISDFEDAPLARLHSECLTGDALGSRRCDCGPQLDLALARISEEGRGVVIYLRGHEGRAIGLVNKMHAYRLQDDGADTVDANLALGLPVDAREWVEAADILADLGVQRVRLMSNNPRKVEGLKALGIEVAREAHQVPATSEAQEYLRTKATRFHHDLILQGVQP
jgi:3,4-dihydroxy 2-butanone 4-phosphate synthase / GTP cyclohydrolase II